MSTVICFEGMNGTGKTTQARALAARLTMNGYANVFVLQDPGVHQQHPAYDTLRLWARTGEWAHSMTPLLLYMAARCELVSEIRRLQAEHADAVIILDRFVPGFYVYGHSTFTKIAGASSSPASISEVAIERIAALLKTCDMINPDVTVFLFCDPAIAMARALHTAGANPDNYERAGMSKAQSLDTLYRAIADNVRAYPYCGRTSCVIDFTDKTPGKPEEVNDMVFDCLVERGLVKSSVHARV